MDLTTDQELMLAKEAYPELMPMPYTNNSAITMLDDNGNYYFREFDANHPETLQRLRYVLKLDCYWLDGGRRYRVESYEDETVRANTGFDPTQDQIDDATIECAIQILEARKNE